MVSVDPISAKSNGIAIRSAHVFGQRNSGTNYLQHLIFRNCVVPETRRIPLNPAYRAAFGWKHGFPAIDSAPDDALAIVVYRDPLLWLDSLVRNPWHCATHLRGLPFSQFIRSEWISVVDEENLGVARTDLLWGREMLSERDPNTGDRFANPMRLRNAKNASFATMDRRFGNILQVRYDSVLAEPESFLNMLCQRYGLMRKPKFDPIVHDRGTPWRGAFVRKPRPQISRTDLAFILNELDLQIERSLGFDHLDALLQRAA